MKSKKILTILLSLAIMFTFMPAMAFAYVAPTTGDEVNYKFSDDLSEIYTSAGVKVADTVRTWNAYGQTTVKADTSKIGDLPTEVKNLAFTYYDLTGSSFTTDGTNALAASYNNGFGPGKGNIVTGLLLVKPSNATAASDNNKTSIFVSLSNLYNFVNGSGTPIWSYEIKLNDKYDSVTAGLEDQPVEVKFVQKWTGTNNKKVTGNPAAATTKVNARAAVATDAKFYIDAVPASTEEIASDAIVENATRLVPYDGAEHVVVMKDLKGFSVKYTVFNETTGTWDPVADNKVVVKDVLDKPLQVAAQVADTATGKTSTKEFRFNLNADPAGVVDFTFNSDDDVKNEPNTYIVDTGATYDPASFTVVKARTENSKADKAAVAANEAELKAYFAERCEFVKTTKKAYPDEEYVTIKKKTMTNAEKTELRTKYATLLKNFGYSATTKNEDNRLVADENTKATVRFVNPLKDNEVEFTSAVSSKTYKGSKTTKKGKLKKSQSFTVKAVCNNGAAVSYKLMNANTPKIKINKSTGKITVKKGIAKGTYKFKVKAYVPGTDLFETQAITVKIKK